MNNYIKEYKNSLSPEFCKHVIDVFENEPNKSEGVVSNSSAVKPNIKNTSNYYIHANKEKDYNWLQIEKHLFEELQSKLLVYIKHLEDSSIAYTYFSDIKILTSTDFGIQRYLAKDGKYEYHQDGIIIWERQTSRVLTFIWYLNDVLEGGETEFFGNYKIKPEAGKLIFFPANWCFPHCGLMPISSNKYIILGCLSMNGNKETLKQLNNKLINDKMRNDLCNMKNELDTLLNNVNEHTNGTNIGFIDEIVDTEEPISSYGRIYKTT